MLTKRQLEIMDLLKLGLTVREVASRLDIAERTVKTHLYDGILPKLGAFNTAHAVYICMRNGIIE